LERIARVAKASVMTARVAKASAVTGHSAPSARIARVAKASAATGHSARLAPTARVAKASAATGHSAPSDQSARVAKASVATGHSARLERIARVAKAPVMTARVAKASAATDPSARLARIARVAKAPVMTARVAKASAAIGRCATVPRSVPRVMTPAARHRRCRDGRWRLVYALIALSGPVGLAQARPVGHDPPRRFTGRLQILSGATLALPELYDGSRHFVAYVPAEAELAIRVSGLLSLGLGGSGLLAPFTLTTCRAEPSPRANALAAFGTLRLDFNNSRDGSWWSPWLALRGGVVGQGGVGSGDPCEERFLLGMYLGPRLGTDLWMGQAAVSFAIGYDHLPRAGGIAIQTGLTLRLF
jgi:hypothetical protein